MTTRVQPCRSTGEKLAKREDMAARKVLDRQPGAVPDIHATGDSVTFQLAVAGAPEHMKLVLRCDAKGDVWAAIVTTPLASSENP